MGAGNVAAALAASTSKLPGRSRDVLYVMALHSLDKPSERRPARVYFGGHVRLVAALGDYPSQARMRRLRAELKTLRDAGLIEPAGRVGRNYIYRLTMPEPVENPVYKRFVGEGT